MSDTESCVLHDFMSMHFWKSTTIGRERYLWLPACRSGGRSLNANSQGSIFKPMGRFLRFYSGSIYTMVYISLRLLIFLPAILIPACASSSPAFLMMYSAYKLNKQGDNIQPWRTPFPIWNQSVVPYPVLTLASWPVFTFLTRQIR